MATDLLPNKCPACGSDRNVYASVRDIETITFDCGNSTWTNSAGESLFDGKCVNAYTVAVRSKNALTFYASAMASDIAYDGGKIAKAALEQE